MALNKLQQINSYLNSDPNVIFGMPYINPKSIPFSKVQKNTPCKRSIYLPVAPREPLLTEKSLSNFTTGLLKGIGIPADSISSPSVYEDTFFPGHIRYPVELGGNITKEVTYEANLDPVSDIIGTAPEGNHYCDGRCIINKEPILWSTNVLNSYWITTYPNEAIMGLAKKDNEVKLKKRGVYISPECERLANEF